MQMERMDYYLFIRALHNCWKHFDYSLSPGSYSVKIPISFSVEIWVEKWQAIENKIYSGKVYHFSCGWLLLNAAVEVLQSSDLYRLVQTMSQCMSVPLQQPFSVFSYFLATRNSYFFIGSYAGNSLTLYSVCVMFSICQLIMSDWETSFA